MCIIIAATKARCSRDMIERAGSTNRDGFGIAYRDGQDAAWFKGLNESEVFELANDVPLPYVVHARLATAGGSVATLTHPFPVEYEPALDLSGKARQVLFHNGHVSEWKAMARIAGADPDLGEWSDSRAIAHAVAMTGPGILHDLSPSRFLLFGAKRGRMFGSWYKHGDGFFLSCSLPSRPYSGSSGGSVTGYTARDIDEWAMARDMIQQKYGRGIVSTGHERTPTWNGHGYDGGSSD